MNALRTFLGTAALLALALGLRASNASAQTFESRIANGNLVGVTLGNYGVLGNAFANRSASFEYPLGSGYEHLTYGGLWVGASVPDSARTSVSTGVLEFTTGSNTANATEFTPEGAITSRSILTNTPVYSPGAVSELDILSDFDDFVPRQPFGSLTPSQPLGLRVHQEAYAWNYGSAQNILFLHYVIHNAWSSPLANVWVGLFTELASGNKGAYSCWPPSSGCGPGSWYARKYLKYDADFRMVREHHCSGSPLTCSMAAVPYWAGVQLLTPPDTAAGQKVTLAAWPYSPGNAARDEDSERYALMSTGAISPLTGDTLVPPTGDPVELLALGPFATLAPGDSLVVDFALIGGANPDSARNYAYLAQKMHDLGYPGTVVATQAALISADASADRVTLRFSTPVPPTATLLVQRHDAASDWRTLAERAPIAGDVLEYVDRDVSPGGSYAYRLGVREAGAERFSPETWITLPPTSRFALEGVRPNPVDDARTDAVAFSLARAGDARLELFDLLGRREAVVRLPALEAGAHAVPFSRLGVVAPGMHLLRLTQGAERAARRVLVLR